MRSLFLLALLTGSLLLAACGAGDDGGDDGSEDNAAAGIVHRLLLAGDVGSPGTLESFAGSLPPGLRVAPPQYPNADLIVSNRRRNEPAGVRYFIILDTGARRSPVFEFYEEALDASPWRLEAAASSAEVDTLEFSLVDDADINGVVEIARGQDDDRTSIFISLQDAGAVLEAPPFQLGESLPLPAVFPPEVPLYEGAIITGTVYFPLPAADTFLLIFLTEANKDDVIAFYRRAFEELGWTVEDSPVSGPGESIDVRDEGRDLRGNVFADRFPDDRRFTEVRLELQLNRSPSPADGGE